MQSKLLKVPKIWTKQLLSKLQEEAEKRGLPNCKSIVDAIPSIVADSTVEMFEKFNILSRAELEARQDIYFSEYAGVRNIEAKAMAQMANRMYIPTAVYCSKDLADTVVAVKNAGADATAQIEMLNEVSEKLLEMRRAVKVLERVTEKAHSEESSKKSAELFKNEVMPAMDNLRKPVDELEKIVEKEVWPVPSYGDMLFY